MDRLSLAYLKNEEVDRAKELLKSAKEENIISNEFEKIQLHKLNVLANNLADLYEKNSRYADNQNIQKR